MVDGWKDIGGENFGEPPVTRITEGWALSKKDRLSAYPLGWLRLVFHPRSGRSG
jgi:hypothetical protein